MKTAISLPDLLFKEAERTRRRLRVSRSELYARALKEYLDSQRSRNTTEALNRVYDSESSQLDPVVAAMQWTSLGREKW